MFRLGTEIVLNGLLLGGAAKHKMDALRAPKGTAADVARPEAKEPAAETSAPRVQDLADGELARLAETAEEAGVKAAAEAEIGARQAAGKWAYEEIKPAEPVAVAAAEKGAEGETTLRAAEQPARVDGGAAEVPVVPEAVGERAPGGAEKPGVPELREVDGGESRPTPQTVELVNFEPDRGGFASPARLVVNGRDVTVDELRAEFFPDYSPERLRISKLGKDPLRPGRQHFKLQFQAEDGRDISTPEGVETRFQPKENAAPVAATPAATAPPPPPEGYALDKRAEAAPLAPESKPTASVSEAERAPGVPREVGPHGPVYHEFYHDAQGALAHLKERGKGDAIGALHHPEVGDFDLTGDIAAKLQAKHPEVVGDLQGFISGLAKVEDNGRTIQLRNDRGNQRAGVRLDFDGKSKRWLLTAFDTDARRPSGKIPDAPEAGLATREGTVAPAGAEPTLNMEPKPGEVKPPAPAAPEASPLDTAATEAAARLKSHFKGETLSANPAGLIGDFAIVGAHKLSRGVVRFNAWSKEMVAEYGPKIKPHLIAIYGKAKRWLAEHAPEQRQGSARRRATQRGSLSVGGPPLPEPAADGVSGKPPAKKTAAATAPPAEPEQLAASPSFRKTKANFLKGPDVADEVKAEVSRHLDTYEQRAPELKRVTFDEVKAEARALDPRIVDELDAKAMKPGETLDPAVRFAAKETLNGLSAELVKRSKALREYEKSDLYDTDKGMEMEAAIARLEADAQRLSDVLIPTRSQDGRHLAYHRMMAEQSWDVDYWLSRARRAAGLKPGEKTPAELVKQVMEAVDEGRQAEEAAGRKWTSTRWKMPEQPAEPKAGEAVKAARRKLARVLMEADKTSRAETLLSIWKAGLLTGVKTHVRNLAGNSAMQAMEEASRVPAAVADIAMSLFSGRRTVQGASGKDFAGAVGVAATKGVAEARQIMRRGATLEQLGNMEVPRELNSGNRAVDAYVNTVFRALKAEDRVFRVYAYERALREQMALAKTKVPTAEMQAEALAYSEFATFNNKNAMAAGWSRLKSALPPAGRAVADFIAPFVNTPANVFARMIDYTPAGTLSALVKVGAETRKTGKFSPAQQRALSMAIGRGMTGSALILAGYYASQNGWASGVRSGDREVRGVKEAAGQQAGSILVNGKWHQVGSLSPGGSLFTLGATLNEEARRVYRRKQAYKQAMGFLGIAGRTVLEQPMLKGLSGFLAAAEDPARGLENLAASQVASVVPTVVGDVATVVNPTRRETRGAITDRLKAKLPGRAAELPERMDVFGRPLEGSRWNAVNPLLSQSARPDLVVKELLARQVPVHAVAPRQAGEESEKSTRLRGIVTGRAVYEELERTVRSGRYRDADKEEQKSLLEKAVRVGRDKVNRRLKVASYDKLGPEEQERTLAGWVGTW